MDAAAKILRDAGVLLLAERNVCVDRAAALARARAAAQRSS